ncbi:MAG: DUF6377 domain-containing protein [Lentimicrobium sp.]|jgi:hypothetical protein|nr:DUF6377 domain-containing protein [Lentimicrobium sp.]
MTTTKHSCLNLILKGVLTFLSVVLFQVPLSAAGEQDSLLKVLDATIQQADKYVAEKELELKQLRELYGRSVAEVQKYEYSARLYNGYESYKYDSAYRYAEKMLLHARAIGEPGYIFRSKLALAFSTLSAGLYKEASEIASSMDTTALDKSSVADYYYFLSTLNQSMADFGAEPYYSDYRNKALLYCNKALQSYKKGSKASAMAKIRELQLMDDYNGAIAIAETYLAVHQPDLHEFAIVASSLGFFYQVAGDTTRAIEQFAKAASADIKTATKETSAIRQVAELLYHKGKVQQAYDYALVALDDANFYNARQRKIEVGRILPIIEAGRFVIIEEQKNRLLFYTISLSVLLVLFAIAFIIIMLQKSRLNAARLKILEQNRALLDANEMLNATQAEIERQNIDLLHTNEKLIEANRIKDEYIGYFFSANSIYIEKTEEIYKMVARKIRQGQTEELLQQANAYDLHIEKEGMFALFDQIFTKLFPDFINRYNQLFEEKDRVDIRPGGALTPEIRIFALIRFGITESERIAKFLDFSVSTVKNYKTKVRNRSIVPNELFEQKIMEIESVKTDFRDNRDS